MIVFQIVISKKRNPKRKGYHYNFYKAELLIGPTLKNGDLDLDYSRKIETMKNQFCISEIKKLYAENWKLDFLPDKNKCIN